MAQFPLLKLTRTGQEMTGMSQGGGKLTFVRVELGDGELKEGDSIETLTALKHGVMQLPLQGYQRATARRGCVLLSTTAHLRRALLTARSAYLRK